MEPNGNRNARIWHDFGLLLERMYKVARTGCVNYPPQPAAMVAVAGLVSCLSWFLTRLMKVLQALRIAVNMI